MARGLAAAANHPGGEECGQLNNPIDAITESADEEAEDNNEVQCAKDECEGDHHQEEARQGSENGDENSAD